MGMLEEAAKRRQQAMYDAYTGQIGPAGEIMERGAAAGGLIGQAMGELIPEPIAQAVASGVEYLGDTEAGQYVSGKYNEFDQYLAENFPNEYKAAGQLADMSNALVGPALARGVARVAKGVPDPRTGRNSTDGQFLSNAGVIVPGFYNATDVKFNDYIPMGEKLGLDEKAQALTKLNKENKGRPMKELLKEYDLLSLAQMKVLGNTKVLDSARFGLGFMSWAADGIMRGGKSLVSPTSRAMFAEYGINDVGVEAINKFYRYRDKMDEIAAREAEGVPVNKRYKQDLTREFNAAHQEVQSQLQQTANIRRQKGIDDDALGTIMHDVAVMAADPDYLKLTGGKPFIELGKEGTTLGGDSTWFKDSVAPLITEKGRGDFTADDAMVMQRHVVDQQKPNSKAQLIVKRPSSAQTGQHYNDLFKLKGSNKHVLDPIQSAFKALKAETGRLKFKDNAEMIDYLKLQQKVKLAGDPDSPWVPMYTRNADGEIVKADPDLGNRLNMKALGKRKTEQNFSIKWDDASADQNKRGIWLNTAMTGSAKVEGAVNALYRVGTDGNMIGMISDKHDFLEKLWGIGSFLKQQLPRDVIAITPPVRANIFKVGSFTEDQLAGRRGRPQAPLATGRKANPMSPLNPDVSLKQQTLDTMDQIKQLKPSAEGVEAQRDYLLENAFDFSSPLLLGDTEETPRIPVPLRR